MNSEEFYTLRYDFTFKDGKKKRFSVHLDPLTISYVPEGASVPPHWTKLDYEQCRVCPLDRNLVERCPIAVNLAHVVEEFQDIPSIEDALIQCIVPERTYQKRAAAQEGLYSIFGVIMATSGCPVLNFFKPMARFHLPFSTIEETIVRSVSIYLLGEYFKYKDGNPPDLDLKKLDENYGRVKMVNEGMLRRISKVSRQDADKNAMLVLHSLSQLLLYEMNADLDSIAGFFKASE